MPTPEEIKRASKRLQEILDSLPPAELTCEHCGVIYLDTEEETCHYCQGKGCQDCEFSGTVCPNCGKYPLK